MRFSSQFILKFLHSICEATGSRAGSFFLVAILLGASPLFCYATDTEKPSLSSDSTSRLSEIVVMARASNDLIPVQTLEGNQLHHLNSNSVADALRYFAGVQVKDYGGVGGIKTVNIRSMGSQHTGVVYDGISLGNAQNGQIDLGQFSLDNVEAISLYNGQKSNLLQPARDFGNAGAVYLRTRVPNFYDNKNFNLKATFRTGSFGLANPSILTEFRLSSKINLSFSSEYIYSNGKYKFRYRRVLPDGNLAYDTTATRQNGDVNALRAEINLNGILPQGEWHAKAYHYNSRRGIPGAIVNNVWRRGERLWDNNNFFQGSLRKTIGLFTTLNNIKYAWYQTRYANHDDRQIQIDNHYGQGELYISSANQYSINQAWHISASYDFIFNNMVADLYDFHRTRRFSNLLSAATSFNSARFRAQASLLATFINESRTGLPSQRGRHAFTPAIFLYGQPLNSPNLSVRTFFKQSYRMPTFNDLYYTDMGNASLKPEKATQYNFGILYQRNFNGIFKNLLLSADAYYNTVKDKIIAYPKGQQFRWTMLNLGKVCIKGIDLSSSSSLTPFNDFTFTLRLQYTYQYAIDITDPSDSYYRHQIPYIPRHSGSVAGNIIWRNWAANYSFIYVGARYGQQENIRVNRLQPWYTNDLSLSKDIAIARTTLRIMLEINNLLSQDYDVILNYPMPKRNYRLTLQLTL